MTKPVPNASSDALLVLVIVFVATGGFLGLSSLFSMRWWVNVIILMVVGMSVLLLFGSEPDAGAGIFGILGLFAIYGFFSTFGWAITVAIVVGSAVLALILSSDAAVAAPPPPASPARSAGTSASPSPPTGPKSVSDWTLTRYARDFLAEGGARETGAVVGALRSRIKEEGLELESGQDLSWIAGRVLATSRNSPAPKRPGAQQPRAEGTTKSRVNAREHLHEFGSFEIERAISRILEESPGLDDARLTDRTLAALEISDRSPFAMERLSDAIGRVRGIASPSAEERQVERRELRVARVPKRDPGGRTKLYEYGSHEIERVVEQLLAADRQLSAKALHEAVLDVLGIEDRSNLARERVADAAAKVAASPIRPSGAAGRRRQPAPKKKPTKKAQKPAAKKATKKQAPVAKKATKSTSRQKDASTSQQNRQAGRMTPPPAPAKNPSKPEGGEGTPDVKDIAKLLGF